MIEAKPTAHITESRHVLLAWHEHLDEAAAAEDATEEAAAAETDDKPVLGQP
jgi:cell shape-determining protein MreC